MDIYNITEAPILAFPQYLNTSTSSSKSNAWSLDNHPALQKDQLRWERDVALASVSSENIILSTLRGNFSIRLRALKGTELADWIRIEGPREAFSTPSYGWTMSGQLQPYESEPRTIVDVGGFAGDTAVLFAHVHPNARIIVFEPNPLNCRYLLWNIRINNLVERVWPLCAGIGATTSIMRIRKCIFWGSARFCQTSGNALVDADATIGDTLEVPVLDVMVLREKFSIEYVDLYKSDCEGCECSSDSDVE